MCDPFEQVIEVFGRDGLIKARKESVSNLLVPDKSKEFLETVGVPKESVLLCEFDLSAFPALNEYALRQGIQIKCNRPFRRIGTDGCLQICISEEGSKGEVWGYDLREEISVRFINRNVETFVAFLALYVKDYCKFNDQPDDILDEYANKLDNKLKSIDSKAFENPESWWSLVIHQLKSGLL